VQYDLDVLPSWLDVEGLVYSYAGAWLAGCLPAVRACACRVFKVLETSECARARALGQPHACCGRQKVACPLRARGAHPPRSVRGRPELAQGLQDCSARQPNQLWYPASLTPLCTYA